MTAVSLVRCSIVFDDDAVVAAVAKVGSDVIACSEARIEPVLDDDAATTFGGNADALLGVLVYLKPCNGEPRWLFAPDAPDGAVRQSRVAGQDVWVVDDAHEIVDIDLWPDRMWLTWNADGAAGAVGITPSMVTADILAMAGEAWEAT